MNAAFALQNLNSVADYAQLNEALADDHAAQAYDDGFAGNLPRYSDCLYEKYYQQGAAAREAGLLDPGAGDWDYQW